MYSQLSIEALVDGFRQGKLCLDSWHRALLDQYADAGHLNSFISFAPQAFSGDTGTPEQRQAPLYGIPVSFKDNINVSGLPTTAGTPGLADYQPAPDAGIVQRFKALGAETDPSTPDEFRELSRRETAKWAKVVKFSGAKID